MRTVLTGATGYLGSHIARELVSSGDVVLAVQRPACDTARIDALIANGLTLAYLDADYGNLDTLLAEFRPDNVIHVAAKSRGSEESGDLSHFIDANVTFGSRLVHAMVAAGVPLIVNAGTSWQWGEDGSFRPFNYYAATKQCFEDILAHYRNAGIDSVSIRLFDVAGPGDDRNRIIDLLIDAGLRGETLQMSPGEQHMFIVDVRDAARAFVHAARSLSGAAPACRTYALRGDSSVSLRELVDMLRGETGVEVDVAFGGRPYRPREIMRPYAGCPNPPGWTARIALPDTLRDMVAYRRTVRTQA